MSDDLHEWDQLKVDVDKAIAAFRMMENTDG